MPGLELYIRRDDNTCIQWYCESCKQGYREEPEACLVPGCGGTSILTRDIAYKSGDIIEARNPGTIGDREKKDMASLSETECDILITRFNVTGIEGLKRRLMQRPFEKAARFKINVSAYDPEFNITPITADNIIDKDEI